MYPTTSRLLTSAVLISSLQACASFSLREELPNIQRMHLLEVMVAGPTRLDHEQRFERRHRFLPGQLEGVLEEYLPVLTGGEEILSSETVRGRCSACNMGFSVEFAAGIEQGAKDAEAAFRAGSGDIFAPADETAQLPGYDEVKAYLDRVVRVPPSAQPDTGDDKGLQGPSLWGQSLFWEHPDLAKVMGSPEVRAFMEKNPGHAFSVAVVWAMREVGDTPTFIAEDTSRTTHKRVRFSVPFSRPGSFKFVPLIDMRVAHRPGDNLLVPTGFLPGGKTITLGQDTRGLSLDLPYQDPPTFHANFEKREFSVQGGSYDLSVPQADTQWVSAQMADRIGKMGTILATGMVDVVNRARAEKE